MKRIIIESGHAAGIPVMTLARESAEHCPTIFFVHGFTADKKEGLPLGYRLADLGFFVVCPDAHIHGERVDIRLEITLGENASNVYPYGSGLDAYFLMHEIILRTAQDIAVLVEHFGMDRRADVNRMGITGISMGGFTTFYAAANHPQVQVAVPMIGIPAFAARWDDVVLEASTYEKWAEAMEAVQDETAKRSAFMRDIDPFEKLKAFYPKPLLMLIGDKDVDAPKKYSVDLYRALKPLYAEHPGGLRLKIHDDAGHQVTPAMMEDACDWFRKYLHHASQP